MTTAEKARAAKKEYMRRYRQTPQGAERIREANERYWARKFDTAEARENSARKERRNEQPY